ncbi:putative CDF zinc transporter [Rhodocollybia butyracea]|uniref:CDF zinc transporter n=1 Tax=Rhodocollybia butyracea TaxID=206335 RepID=A0A9P5PGA3_9AGAR|nr:putative CDF zinc transporter [Rhodocollybia butyracea]
MKSTHRLAIVLAISASFFIAEISVGFKTKSIALIADAFHYLNDVVAYAIAFIAAYVQDRGHKRKGFTYAFHRAELVGAFFNGVFLLALALSIFLQSLERFIQIQEVQDPQDVLIVGCVGLALNILSVLFVHGKFGDTIPLSSNLHKFIDVVDHGSHGHAHDALDGPDAIEMSDEIKLAHAGHHHVRASPSTEHSQNLGLLAVLIHLCGDAVNNIGVIIAAILIWKLDSPNRFYADPAASMLISFIIFGTAIPLTTRTGRILLEAAPINLDLQKLTDDLNGHLNVISIHDLHVWHLSQSVILASVHVCVPSGMSLLEWEETERSLHHCFAEYGVAHVTISPESQHTASQTPDTQTIEGGTGDELLGKCKVFSKDSSGCIFDDKPVMRKRSTQHSHA